MRRGNLFGGLVVLSSVTFGGLVETVDTRFGSERWHGSCPIGPCVPHGSAMPSPDTLYPYEGRTSAPPSGYYPGDPVVGFSQLHCQGTGGTPTYGLFLVSPTTGEGDREEDLASPFTVRTARPHLLEGRLEKWGIDVRLAPTAHGAIYEFKKVKVEGEGEQRNGDLRIVVNARRKIGLRDACGGNPVKHEGSVWRGNSSTVGHWVPGSVYAGFYAEEERVEPDVVVFRIAVSFRTDKTAEEYFVRELKGRTLDAVVADAARQWEAKLGTIALVGADAAEERRFYSHLYHTFTQPRDRTDDFFGYEKGAPVWDDHYTVWDTWKTLFPLMAITDPAALASVVNSFSARAEKNGFCASAFIAGQEYRVGQGGDDVDNVVADAILKRIPGVDVSAAWSLLKQHAAVRTRAYRQKGYVEENRRDGYCGRMHSGSSTLAFAYNDFCASAVAAKLGKADAAAELRARAGNWTNVWNAAMRDEKSGFAGFVWGRDAKGGWDMVDDWDGSVVPMKPDKGYNFAFYEGTPWEYSFNVWHDIPGLVAKMGGQEKFVARLEYALEQKFIDFGNEPSFMTPWLFDFVGRTELTAKWAPCVRALFRDDGCPGDDDSGAMAALYVFLTAGFYPIAGQDLYALHGPMMPEVRFNLSNGKTFTVRCATVGAAWTRMILNGKPLERPFIRHADIVSGGVLEFK